MLLILANFSRLRNADLLIEAPHGGRGLLRRSYAHTARVAQSYGPAMRSEDAQTSYAMGGS
jgi:hypothetical protein